MGIRFSALVLAAGLSAAIPAYGQSQTPRLANGRPDLSASWNTGLVDFIVVDRDEKGNVSARVSPEAQKDPALKDRLSTAPVPPYKPEFKAKVAELTRTQVKTDPVLRCGNPGVPRIGPPAKILQSERELIFLYSDVNGNFWRIIPLDRPHRSDADPSFLGDSAGRWEGDTLVVEVVNFNDESWLIDNGAFHTDKLRVVEKLRRDGETLHYQATIYDSDVLTGPWEMPARTLRLAKNDPQESPPCAEQSLDQGVESYHMNPR